MSRTTVGPERLAVGTAVVAAVFSLLQSEARNCPCRKPGSAALPTHKVSVGFTGFLPMCRNQPKPNLPMFLLVKSCCAFTRFGFGDRDNHQIAITSGFANATAEVAVVLLNVLCFLTLRVSVDFER